MSSMNNVSLIGRLTQDPDLRYTQSGKAVSSFGIAINEKYKSGDEWKTDVCFVEIKLVVTAKNVIFLEKKEDGAD